MDKDTLLKFLDSYGADALYNELNNTKDVGEFVKKHKNDLRKYRGYSDIEKPTKSLKEQVAEHFDEYTNVPKAYILDFAEKNNFSVEDVNKALSELQLAKEKKDKEQALKDKEAYDTEVMKNRKDATDNYVHKYLGMDSDNFFNKILNGLADAVISDNTRHAIETDPDNTSRIYGNFATDIGGNAMDFTPGYGKILKGLSMVGQPITNTVRSIYEGDDVGDALRRGATDALVGIGFGGGIGGFPNLPESIKSAVETVLDKTGIKKMTKNADKVDELERTIKTKKDDIKKAEKAMDETDNMGDAFRSMKEDGEIQKAIEPQSPLTREAAEKEIKNQKEQVKDLEFRLKRRSADPKAVRNGRIAKGVITGTEKEGVKYGLPFTENKKTESEKISRWEQGFATIDERNTQEYKDWLEQNTRKMMGVE